MIAAKVILTILAVMAVLVISTFLVGGVILIYCLNSWHQDPDFPWR